MVQFLYPGFPGGASGKEPTCNAGNIRDEGSIPGSGRSPGRGYDNPLPYSRLENPMDRGAWQATPYRVAKSGTTEVTYHTARTSVSERQPQMMGVNCSYFGDISYIETTVSTFQAEFYCGRILGRKVHRGGKRSTSKYLVL